MFDFYVKWLDVEMLVVVIHSKFIRINYKSNLALTSIQYFTIVSKPNFDHAAKYVRTDFLRGVPTGIVRYTAVRRTS